MSMFAEPEFLRAKRSNPASSTRIFFDAAAERTSSAVAGSEAGRSQSITSCGTLLSLNSSMLTLSSAPSV